MANIPFPNVPDAPGVPQIPRSSLFPPVAQAGLSTIQAIIYRAFQVSSQWGIYNKNGKALGDPAQFTGRIGGAIETIGLGSTLSTNAVDYAKDTRVSDFPIERGSFASYNKVETPANPIVTLCLSGGAGDRRAFIDEIDKASKSTDLYSVVTPEVTYINYAIERYNYQRRSSRGATLLLIEITLKEIREISTQYTQSIKTPINNPKNASATPPADNGKVQAKTPRVSVLKSIANKAPSLAERANQYLQGVLK